MQAATPNLQAMRRTSASERVKDIFSCDSLRDEGSGTELGNMPVRMTSGKSASTASCSCHEYAVKKCVDAANHNAIPATVIVAGYMRDFSPVLSCAMIRTLAGGRAPKAMYFRRSLIFN